MSVAVCLGVFLATCLGVCRPAAAQDIAGLWVRDASLVSSAAIRQLVEDASSAGFTTLLVQVSPILPAVADHLDAQLTRLLSRYAFDGIHLDGVQFPSSDFDYGPAAVAAFRVDIAAGLTDARRRDLDTRAAIDPLTYPDAFPSEWSRFRRSAMTALVARLGNTVRQARRSVRVSVSVVADHDEALGRRLQDWRTWVENGFVDVLCLRPGIETSEDFERQVRAARQFSSGADLWVGIAAGQLPAADSVDRIRAARRLGVAGVVISAHDTVTDGVRMPPDHLQHLGRALSAPSTP